MTFRVLCLSLACGFLWAQNGTDPWSQSYKLEIQKDYAQAAKVIAPFRESNEFAQLRWAYLTYMQGKYDESAKAYQKALEMNPKSLDALLGMTLPLMAQKRWSEAAAKAQKAIEASPWHYTAEVRLLYCAEAQSQWDVLLSRGRELARRYPSDATAVRYWARGAAMLGQTQAAREAYRRVLELYPGHTEAEAYLKSKSGS